MEPTNRDLLDRMETLENKVDGIMTKLDQAAGAWLFIKWMGSIVIGATIVIGAVHDWWVR